jgi:hypothetical protein
MRPAKKLAALVFLLTFCCISIPGSCAKAAPASSKPGVSAPAGAGHASSHPDQPTVAAKKEFGTVRAADAAVTKALDAKDLAGARKLVGKPGAFRGKVSEVYSPASHSITILDFAPNYRQALTAVVKPEQYKKFPSLRSLRGKQVLVTGTFTTYRDSVQIELTDPSQLRLVRTDGGGSLPRKP